MAESFSEAVGTGGLAAGHEDWLSKLVIPGDLAGEWRTHATFVVEARTEGWTHYAVEPADMIWRFSSKPASEFISITDKTPIATIIQVIGKHSGGAEKSNVHVRTSSWCRSPGALIGTAASSGGDKKVLQIANCAEYLLGIELDTLAAHGISAHPALYRLISMFETEYVLVPTPGNAPVSLDKLATVKIPNPFKGRILPSGEIIGSKHKLAISDPQSGFAKPWDPIPFDKIATTEPPPPDWAETVLRIAVRSCAAATKLSGAVKDKEAADDPRIKKNAMRQYVSLL